MKKFRIGVVLALFTLFTGTGLLYAQGLYFEALRSGRDVPSAKVSYMPGMAKVVTQSGHVVVLRIDKELVSILNPGRKTYTEISFDDLENKQFANLTPDQRRVLTERMARERNSSNDKADRDVEETNETKTIDGFKCTKYVMKKDGQITQTIWATNDVKGADDLRKDAEKLLDRLGSMTGMQQPLAEWISTVDGFPIRIEGRGSTTTIRNIKQQSIPESEFSVPSGYTRAGTMQQGGNNENQGKGE